MKTKKIIQLFLLAFVSFSLYSCTEDTLTDTKSQAAEVTPSKPKIPTDATAEDFIYKPK